MKKAIYPGSFDPFTLGHLDILRRASTLFDAVIIAVARNESKKPLFSQAERMALIEENIRDLPNVTLLAFHGLTVETAKKEGAQVIIRGLRAISDFEFEFQMAQMNQKMAAEIETVFLMPNKDFFYTSSRLMKEVARFQPDNIQTLVPANVHKALKVALYER